MEPGVPPARLTSDPALEVCPNFASPAFAGLRNALVQTDGIPLEQTAAHLSGLWADDNAERCEVWAAQLEADRVAEEAAQAERDAADLADRDAAAQKAREEAAEAEKKRPKMPAYSIGMAAPETIRPRIAPYARNKLKSFQYVELWYFTAEGLAATAGANRSSADDAYGFVQTNDTMALKPLNSFKAAKSVVCDTDLSWVQLSTGSAFFMDEVRAANWEPHAHESLRLFFYAIFNHPSAVMKGGIEGLIAYQAIMRQEWHDSLALDTADAERWDLGVFLEYRLVLIRQEQALATSHRLNSEVSPPPPSASHPNFANRSPASSPPPLASPLFAPPPSLLRPLCVDRLVRVPVPPHAPAFCVPRFASTPRRFFPLPLDGCEYRAVSGEERAALGLPA
ncbi:hypothetical protein B0H21DRAFT_699252 [Amylocystis lapponica]|nr:hypothetical protein B0H21DRAFT_699252 [Amylocystis lapponica]